MKLAFIGDIVGSPGREMLKEHLKKIKTEYSIDVVVANYENASHGFGLTSQNAKELFGYGVDIMSGGNHTFDKKDILPLLEDSRVLRPHNYPDEVAGSGCRVYDVAGEKLAVINLLGHYAMPVLENCFKAALKCVDELHSKGVKNIFVDFHAEATSEKRAMMMLLQGKVSGIIGTHTHVGTDDFYIYDGSAYLSDIGLSGCRDNVIGMDKDSPLQYFLSGVKSHFDIPKKCKKILQIAILDIEDGRCKDAIKLKVLDDRRVFKTEAWHES
ncbi:MAG: TIGR00282 family metallophosphoesterase [Sulfurimonadaceae bacterium]|nr:TIGR00282 family metallophosphoesterase [Sulfurimonadaceae bacterium]